MWPQRSAQKVSYNNLTLNNKKIKKSFTWKLPINLLKNKWSCKKLIGGGGAVQKSYTRTDPGHVVAVPNPLVFFFFA